MDLLSELNRYFVERKWCQLLELLHKKCFSDTETCVNFIINNYSELLSKTHLHTLSNIISLITDISPNHSLLKTGIDYLNSIEFRSTEQEEALLTFNLNNEIINYKDNRNVYEYLKIKILDSCKERFYLLMFLYFDHSMDYTQAYKYLTLYLECLNLKKEFEKKYYEERKKILYNNLAGIALYSEDVYSFDNILTELEESELKSLVYAYNIGDINYVNSKEHSFPKEKVYLISLVKLTVYKRSISLNEISSFLKLDIKDVLFLVFKSLGKGLIKGYYNGKDNELYLHKSINKAMNEEEIKEMKSKFEDWRNKVSKEIESI
ncbi:hypothetical protein H312_01684 [Anncaliia algerae PRA339]|uniref:PCI domain-containing protein n=1 Tax=Anncaliia algerae PRA339 TaxID=1288291 RepID=A0A059F1Q6_9MICR|nr:hypothetical protein H312_01684 [Anncaliia algerae PRA339]